MEKLREGIWDNTDLFEKTLMPEIQKEVQIILVEVEEHIKHYNLLLQ